MIAFPERYLMKSLTDIMINSLNKYDVYYRDELLSKEHLLQAYAEFLASSFCKEKHNLQIVLHTGSKCFDIFTVLISALSNLVLNETTSGDVVCSLNLGDKVLYKKKRYHFGGIIENIGGLDGKFAILKVSDTDKTYAPEKLWIYIEPYYGSSEQMDGRGIKKGKSKRFDFINKVFNYDKTAISGVVDSSAVVVMPREKANDIINNIKISYDGNKHVNLLDIITVSYFTDEGESCYSGNPSRTEPVLKITNNISVARDLVISKGENKIIGLSVLDADIIERGKTELPELVNRRSLTYVILACNIDAGCCTRFIREANEPNVFPCTKKFLQANNYNLQTETKLTKELYTQADTIVNNEINIIISTTNVTWNEYKELKRALYAIRNSDILSEYKDNFLKYAYSLLNLFLTAVFSLETMEKLINQNILYIESPQERINKLHVYSEKFYDIYKDKAKIIIDQLSDMYLKTIDTCPKEQLLIKHLKENNTKKIALIVPKAYYSDIVKANGLQEIMSSPKMLIVSTPNRFDKSQIYDEIITSGDVSGRHFNTFRCSTAKAIYAILYDFEQTMFNFRYKNAKEVEKLFNDQSYTPVDSKNDYDKLIYDDDSISDKEIQELEVSEFELAEYVSRINDLAAIQKISLAKGNTTSATTSVVRLGTFLDEHKIFFTKAYKAYVFDSENESVNEVSVGNLSSGDTLIFTHNTSYTKDIVDVILNQLIETNNVDAIITEAYEKSKYWKEVLHDYMKMYNLGYGDISRKMKELSASRTSQAVRSWFDEDAHIVGPNELKVFQSIAELTKDEFLLDDFESFYKSCRIIRRIRGEILKLIGKTIINKLCGQLSENDMLQKMISEHMDNLAVMLQLDTVTDINEIQIPINMANNPITI